MDFERVALLLVVEEKTRGHPYLEPIRNAAMDELRAIANPPPEEKNQSQSRLSRRRTKSISLSTTTA